MNEPKDIKSIYYLRGFMKLLASLCAFLLSGVVSATPLNNIVVFGDSLSDNGNLYEYMKHQLPQSPPYFEGRFSNGPVWIERLAASYFPNDPNSHLLDYAFGGAGVSVDEEDDEVFFTLRREVNSYLLAHQDKASPDSLFVIWIGANNYLGMPVEVEETLKNVNRGITDSIQRLVDKGAKHILVLNLPDLGRTPAALEFGSVEEMNYFSTQHNNALSNTVDYFKKTYPEVEWLFFDTGSHFDHVIEHATEYGFTNITGTCSFSIVDEITKNSVLKMVASVKPELTENACDGYLFFDLVHPTALAHKIMAEKARLMLDEAGVEFAEN
ncbi:TPA: lysophospholipase [Legionella pneumophila]|nr:SGNH/GDSL hydrolase family protein [Legionella pneumophila]HAT8919707.1 lysophospholipase [Legionella pneumophila subsp. pneumophila]HAT6805281.1 lysophospholipase [Legionella pneumophila]HAT6815517.1 lysophospholipase [Legionella pneumophila]HAT6824415.1 lysophospholipase [Legionella pneumophila]